MGHAERQAELEAERFCDEFFVYIIKGEKDWLTAQRSALMGRNLKFCSSKYSSYGVSIQ